MRIPSHGTMYVKLGGVQITIGKKTSLFDFPHVVTKMLIPFLDLRLQLRISLILPQDSAEVEAGADISFLDSKKTLNFKTVRADHQVLLLELQLTPPGPPP